MVGRRRRAARVRAVEREAMLSAVRDQALGSERALRASEGGVAVRSSQVKRWGNVAQDVADDLDALLAP